MAAFSAAARQASLPASSGVLSGLVGRVFRSLAAARQRNADRDIAEILSRQGGIMRSRERSHRSYPFHTLRTVDPR